MLPHDLIQTARDLVESDDGRLTQTLLRRAVSTAYYAMFHALAATAADLIMGPARSPEWHLVHRALEHVRARSAYRQWRLMGEFPADVRAFAGAFVALQTEQQRADYMPDMEDYEVSDVLEQIASAEQAIARFERADSQTKRNFVVPVLFDNDHSEDS